MALLGGLRGLFVRSLWGREFPRRPASRQVCGGGFGWPMGAQTSSPGLGAWSEAGRAGARRRKVFCKKLHGGVRPRSLSKADWGLCFCPGRSLGVVAKAEGRARAGRRTRARAFLQQLGICATVLTCAARGRFWLRAGAETIRRADARCFSLLQALQTTGPICASPKRLSSGLLGTSYPPKRHLIRIFGLVRRSSTS